MKKLLKISKLALAASVLISFSLIGTGQVSIKSDTASNKPPREVKTPEGGTEVGRAKLRATEAENEESRELFLIDSIQLADEKKLR